MTDTQAWIIVLELGALAVVSVLRWLGVRG